MKDLKKELDNLVKEIDNGVEKSTKELGKKSLEYMRKQYSKNNLSSHIGNITLTPYKKDFKKGFILSSGDDEIAVYNEFGTGIVGAENPNPLASEAKKPYKYNAPSLYKGKIPDMAYYQYTKQYLEAVNTPNTWWYFKNGKWWHTEGMKGKQMYSSLVDELRKNAPKEFKTSIGQVIGNYNSGGKK